MNLKIIHETNYVYSKAVFLEPHTLRFKPKATSFYTLKSFSLDVRPKASGISENFDPENNRVHMCWFNGLMNELWIRAESVVEVKDHNPFSFLIHPQQNTTLPVEYSQDEKNLLVPALFSEKLSPQVLEYLQNVRSSTKDITLEFILSLTRNIHKNFKVETREKGIPLEAVKTFKIKRGSCRDLAWMEIQLLRNSGIAARFVSGYYYLETENPEFELHAWLEAYLPGAGWIGFDPSHGVLTGSLHIPVCQSVFYKNTLPVTGKLRGDAHSELLTSLKIFPV